MATIAAAVTAASCAVAAVIAASLQWPYAAATIAVGAGSLVAWKITFRKPAAPAVNFVDDSVYVPFPAVGPDGTTPGTHFRILEREGILEACPSPGLMTKFCGRCPLPSLASKAMAIAEANPWTIGRLVPGPKGKPAFIWVPEDVRAWAGTAAVAVVLPGQTKEGVSAAVRQHADTGGLFSGQRSPSAEQSDGIESIVLTEFVSKETAQASHAPLHVAIVRPDDVEAMAAATAALQIPCGKASVRTGAANVRLGVVLLEGTAEFLVTVSVSHCIADAFTMYAIQGMLADGTEVCPLSPQRKGSWTGIPTSLGESTQRKVWWWLLSRSLSPFRLHLAGEQAVKTKQTAEAVKTGKWPVFSARYELSSTWVEQQKAQHKPTPRAPFVSTNDVITAWFFRRCNADAGFAVYDQRGRVPGVDFTLAGNYGELLGLFAEEFSAAHVRTGVNSGGASYDPNGPLSSTSEGSTPQSAVKADKQNRDESAATNGLPPAVAQSKPHQRGRIERTSRDAAVQPRRLNRVGAMVSNWCAFHRPLSLPNCAAVDHGPWDNFIDVDATMVDPPIMAITYARPGVLALTLMTTEPFCPERSDLAANGGPLGPQVARMCLSSSR